MMETAADEEGQRGVIINTASIAAYEGQVRVCPILPCFWSGVRAG